MCAYKKMNGLNISFNHTMHSLQRGLDAPYMSIYIYCMDGTYNIHIPSFNKQHFIVAEIMGGTPIYKSLQPHLDSATISRLQRISFR